MKHYAMRFISGKYQGGEFPLPPNSEIVIGRSSDLDMVLVEDMASRRHAKITVDAEQVTIQDLGSTNGTFVNGERIKRAGLTDGDRILIGTSIIKLVTSDAPLSARPAGKPLQQVHVPEAKRTNQVHSMSGTVDEVPLPDLLQLFGSSRKTGTLVVKTEIDLGKIYLENGVIVNATINDSTELAPQKCVNRIVTWAHGTFYMEPAEEGALPTRCELSPEAAVTESARTFEEVRRIVMVPVDSHVAVPRPLTAKLRDLSPDQLDVFQVALDQPQIEAVFNNSPLDDIQIAGTVALLIEQNYLAIVPPESD